MYGNFYVYDSIGPVADLLQRQRGFNSTQIGMLNAIYNLPNVVLILVGGVLVDRQGAARVTLCTAAVSLAGAALTAFSPSFGGMAAGRLLFGIGAETFMIGMLVAIAEYFAGSSVAFSMGFGRLGSFSANISPRCFADAYHHGWQPPLMIAALIAAVSFTAAIGYWWFDRRIRGNTPARVSDTARRFVSGDLLRFGSAYWYLLALCVLWYAVIYAFRSTFSIEYFQHAHGLDLAGAGAINNYVFLAAIFTTPSIRGGVRSDRSARTDANVPARCSCPCRSLSWR
jgi:MFS family permease